jgi:hypothetical protein
MLKLSEKNQKVSTLILIFQTGIAIAILCTLIGIVFSILNILSLIPSEFLQKNWVGVFLPDIHLTIGSLIFPVSLQTQYIHQIFLYLGVSVLPILILLFYACFQLKKVFKSFETKNEAFTRANSISFKKIGIATVITVVIQFIIDFGYGSFLSLIINTAEKNSSELIGVAVNTHMIFIGMLVASIFFGLANMFSQGVELKEDNESII